uniref:C3H1-type domain-containing protein n=1 Tax=Bicosoecida sp. CB-2014 TaxID=1486930 RepID=A0A7S1G671_9STRA|mmetsp:Transcript_14462/g.50315  ORF Transcript_14462/g.50315 Transcript_14462/m.50315 type:complete len:811 (+) Transcript_14462:310-2742(+)
MSGAVVAERGATRHEADLLRDSLQDVARKFATQTHNLYVLAAHHAKFTGVHPLAGVEVKGEAVGAPAMAASDLPKVAPTPFERDLLQFVDQHGGIGKQEAVRNFVRKLSADLQLQQRLLLLHVLLSTRRDVLQRFAEEKGIGALKKWIKDGGPQGLGEADKVVVLEQTLQVLLRLPATIEQVAAANIAGHVGKLSRVQTEGKVVDGVPLAPTYPEAVRLIELADMLCKHWMALAERKKGSDKSKGKKNKKSKHKGSDKAAKSAVGGAGAAVSKATSPTAAAAAAAAPAAKPSKPATTAAPSKPVGASSRRGRASGPSLARRQREAASHAPEAKRSRTDGAGDSTASAKAVAVKRARSPDAPSGEPAAKSRPGGGASPSAANGQGAAGAMSPPLGFTPFRGAVSRVVMPASAVPSAAGGVGTGAAEDGSSGGIDIAGAPPKRKKKKKTLTWAPDAELCKIKVFESEFEESLPPARGGYRAAEHDEGAILRKRMTDGQVDDGDDFWGSDSTVQQTLEPTIPWRAPPKVQGFVAAPELVSQALSVQRRRLVKTMEAVYKEDHVPLNPVEDKEAHAAADEPAGPPPKAFPAYVGGKTAQQILHPDPSPTTAPAVPGTMTAADIVKVMSALTNSGVGVSAPFASATITSGMDFNAAMASMQNAASYVSQQSAPGSLMGAPPPVAPAPSVGGSVLGSAPAASRWGAPGSAAGGGLLPPPSIGAGAGAGGGLLAPPTSVSAPYQPSTGGYGGARSRRRWDSDAAVGGGNAGGMAGGMAGGYRPQSQMPCKHFGTSYGCRHGSGCRFFHDYAKFPHGR